MLAAAPAEEKFLTGDNRNISAKVQATVVMAGPMELNNEKSIENYRKQKEQSYGFKWIGKLYDDAPDLYREASPITYLSKDTGPMLFLTGSLDNPSRDTPPMDKLKSLGDVARHNNRIEVLRLHNVEREFGFLSVFKREVHSLADRGRPAAIPDRIAKFAHQASAIQLRK